MENKVSATLSAEAQNNIAAAINVIQENLPNLINLTPDERQVCAKLGDKSLSFVGKALEYARQNPAVVPPYIDVNEFERDLNLYVQLTKLLYPLHQLVEKLDDTTMQAGSEAYSAALLFYNAVKGAARAGVPGVKNIVDDLQTRFPGRKNKNADVTSPSGN